jgi:hypothetical protein
VASAAAKAAPVAENVTAGTPSAAAQPGASTDGSSAQPASAGGLPSIDAATQQAATAIANATQNNVQNIVVVIRINSPGDDVISQSNTAAAVAVPTNTATTQQGTGAAAPADQADPSGSPDATATPADGASGGGTQAAGSPPAPSPAQAEPPATTPAVTPLRVLTAAPERARPRIAVPPPASSDRAGAAHRRGPAAEPAATPVRTAGKPTHSVAQTKVAPRQTTHAAPGPVSAPSPRKSWLSVTSVPTRIGKAAATRVGAGAAHFVNSLAPRGRQPTAKGDSISTTVLVSLLAVALAVLLGSHPAIRARAWR